MNMFDNLSLEDIDVDLLKKIPLEICRKYKVIPIEKINGKIYVAMYESSHEIIKYLQQNFSAGIIPVKKSEKTISKLIDAGFRVNISGKDYDIEDNIISDAIDKNASDIHFEPFEKEILIKYRLNGSLILMFKLDIIQYSNIVTRIKIKGNMDFSDKLRPQDGKIAYKMENNQKLDLRVSSLPTYFGEKIVIRILYVKWEKYNLKNLNFFHEDLEVLKRILSLKNGMVVINGPTGAGKSTTLYSFLNEERKKEVNITTIEDPVEILIKGINQVNVNVKAGVTFSKGLRSILRQDPDIIMIGEIRDEETAKIAIRAAITGHKVYTTIHTKSPYEVFSRLKEMGIEEYLLVDSLIAVISQRLIKKNCSRCLKIEKIDEPVKNSKRLNLTYHYKGCGCEHCNYTGIEGRLLIYDILIIKGQEKNNIRSYLKGEANTRFTDKFFSRLSYYLKKGEISLETYLTFIEGENIDSI